MTLAYPSCAALPGQSSAVQNWDLKVRVFHHHQQLLVAPSKQPTTITVDLGRLGIQDNEWDVGHQGQCLVSGLAA